MLILKKPDQHRAVAFSHLLDYLIAAFEESLPALVAKERMLHTAALLKVSGGDDNNIRMHAGLHANVEGLCARYGVPWTEAADSTIRKHFIGKGKLGSRDETKRAVVDRCHLLKLLKPDSADDNIADAIAVHDWACATYACQAVSKNELFLFGEEPGSDSHAPR